MEASRTPQPAPVTADGKRVVVVDTRVVALVLGMVGAVLGVVALVGDLPVLGALAGLTALGAGLSAVAGGSGAHDDPASDAAPPSAVRGELAEARAQLDEAHRRIARLESEADEADPTTDEPRLHDDRLVLGAAGEPSALTDPESGLFSEAYFRVALESRLASARRHLRPVAVGLIEVAEGMALDRTSPAASHNVTAALRETVREADIACRLDDGTYAVVLEDTPENGAVWTVERIRRNLVSRFGTHTMWAGIACYPAHAFSTDDLITQARIALRAAQEWKQDRIEVAVAD